MQEDLEWLPSDLQGSAEVPEPAVFDAKANALVCVTVIYWIITQSFIGFDLV